MSQLPNPPFNAVELIQNFNDDGPRPKVYSSLGGIFRTIAADLRHLSERDGITFLSLDTAALNTLLTALHDEDDYDTGRIADGARRLLYGLGGPQD